MRSQNEPAEGGSRAEMKTLSWLSLGCTLPTPQTAIVPSNRTTSYFRNDHLPEKRQPIVHGEVRFSYDPLWAEQYAAVE